MIDGQPRFLVVRLGSLGDVIHAVPAVAALRRRYPDARIDWMVDPRYMEIVRLVTAVDRVIPVDPRGGISRLGAAFRALWGAKYDAAIDLQGLVKSAVLARAAVPLRVIGFASSELREPWARVFYSQVPAPAATRHVVQKCLALLRTLDVTETAVSFPMTVPHTEPVERLDARYGRGQYVLLQPGAAWPNKRWPALRFGALAAAIRRQWELPSVVLWGPGEEPLAREVAAASEGAAVPAPATSATDLFGVAKGASLIVSGDTGPLHIAAAAGTPVVAVFGPTDPARNGPWSLADVTISRFERCECRYERRCRRDRPCIEEVGVEEVLAAVGRRLGSAGRTPVPAAGERGGA